MGEVIAADQGELPTVVPALTEEDRAALQRAVRALEQPSLAARLAALAGAPLEMLGRAVPKPVSEIVSRATHNALRTALRVALATLPRSDQRAGVAGRAIALATDGSGFKHKAAAAVTGAVGGAFGLASLPLELPISTTIMLRSIAEIARQEGEDLSDPEAALSCVQVFALGAGRREGEDFAEGAYFAVRGALARSVAEAARYVAERGLLEESAPVMIRLGAQIASRFGLVVSQKVAAQAVPVIGALGGAAANAAFMDHFQTIARAHFAVRRLERTYGKDVIRAAYDEIRTREAA